MALSDDLLFQVYMLMCSLYNNIIIISGLYSNSTVLFINKNDKHKHAINACDFSIL